MTERDEAGNAVRSKTRMVVNVPNKCAIMGGAAHCNNCGSGPCHCPGATAIGAGVALGYKERRIIRMTE